ncbi:MAG: sugar isomerase domain-containing protein, partial [Caldilineaceae bacterium]|nr:sugar isomerase domain-containing protein [Caldilineaceae bacterium]
MYNYENSATAYLDAAQAILERIRTTQLENIEQAADICTTSIAGDGLVHLFGTGHSRMFVEEMFPRHGSYPGFHSMVELSLTFHNQVVGANGQRQAMFLEKVEGLAKTIMRNFVFSAPDSFMIFSNSGVNEVVVEMALEAKARNLPVIALVSLDHCLNSKPR